LITETWLNPAIPFVCNYENFTMYRADRSSKRGGGVCIFITNKYYSNVIKTPKVAGVDLIAVDFYSHDLEKELRIVNVYVPPSSSLNVIENLCAVISGLITNDNYIIVTGDFNLHIENTNWKNSDYTNLNQQACTFLNFCNMVSLKQMISEPTHGTRILDLLLTNVEADVKNIDISCPFSGSDHNKVSFVYMGQLEKILQKKIIAYNKCDFDRLNEEIANINWDLTFSLLCTNNFDIIYTTFIEILNNLVISLTPTIVVSNKRYLPPNIKSQMEYKEKLWKNIKYKKVREKFILINKKIKKELLKFFQAHEKKLLSSPNQKNIYNYISSQLKSPNNYIPSLRAGNGMVFTDREKAEVLSDYFSTVFLPPGNKKIVNVCNSLSKLSNIEVNPQEIYNILRNLPNKCNTSPDQIPNIILKKCASGLAYPLTLLFNYSIANGMVPQLWKMSIIQPLYKKGSPNEPQNYRPISLTSSISKVLEKILHNKLYTFFKINNIIPNHQHGF